MLGRSQIALPVPLWTTLEQQLEPLDLQVEGDESVRVYPPYKSGLDPRLFEPYSDTPLVKAVTQLGPADPQPTTPLVRLEAWSANCTEVSQERCLRDHASPGPSQ